MSPIFCSCCDAGLFELVDLVEEDDGEAVVIDNRAYVFETVHGLFYRLLRCVEVVGDTADGVTTPDSEDDLRRRIVEHLAHLVVANILVIAKNITRLWPSMCSLFNQKGVAIPQTAQPIQPHRRHEPRF